MRRAVRRRDDRVMTDLVEDGDPFLGGLFNEQVEYIGDELRQRQGDRCYNNPIQLAAGPIQKITYQVRGIIHVTPQLGHHAVDLHFGEGLFLEQVQ